MMQLFCETTGNRTPKVANRKTDNKSVYFRHYHMFQKFWTHSYIYTQALNGLPGNVADGFAISTFVIYAETTWGNNNWWRRRYPIHETAHESPEMNLIATHEGSVPIYMCFPSFFKHIKKIKQIQMPVMFSTRKHVGSNFDVTCLKPTNHDGSDKNHCVYEWKTIGHPRSKQIRRPDGVFYGILVIHILW